MLSRQAFFVRYRRESFGVLWSVGLPLIQAVVLAVVFSKIVKIDTPINYPTFVFAGILPWTFFSATITGGATSIVDGQHLATKIYFPRAVLPLVIVQSGLYGFIPGVAVLVAMALVLGVSLGAALLYLIPALALILVLSAAFALLLGAVQVYFRDVRYIITAAIFAWFYATPVLYPLNLAPPFLRKLIQVNPVTGVVELFRAAVGGADPRWPISVAIASAWVVVLVAIACVLHQRLDRVFVDPL